VKRAPRELTTPRLRLRQFAPADHAPYAAMCADREVMRFIGTGAPMSSDDAWRGIAAMLGHWVLLGYGMWAVESRDGGELIGRVGFIDPPGWPGFELGWLLARPHWGHGYAREAATAALDVAWRTLERERVISLIRPANERSIRLARSLGASEASRIDFMGGEIAVYAHGRAG
jgi:RimJ/RimL family protein N-acetyltransferase